MVLKHWREEATATATIIDSAFGTSTAEDLLQHYDHLSSAQVRAE
jgi:uncharacterized protein (DUF433 family)